MRFLLADALLKGAAIKEAPNNGSGSIARRPAICSAPSSTENEYSDRALNLKIKLMGLEGDFTKPVDKIDTFEGCFYRARYGLQQVAKDAEDLHKASLDMAEKFKGVPAIGDDERKKLQDAFIEKQKSTEKKRDEHTQTMLAALERGLSRPDAKTKAGNDVKNARAMLAFYYLTSRSYAKAIVAGKKFAREDSHATQAGLAAAYALQAYGASISIAKTR